jgi:hypothetical protein
MQVSMSKDKYPVVITIHGIRTTGKWQKELTDELFLEGYRHFPIDFGFFTAIQLLMPWSRAKKVEWFRNEYNKICEKTDGKKSIIAHSFGSYIVTEALSKYCDITFDRVILCGSIVRRDYPWGDIICKRKQVNYVLNEAGGRDTWSVIAEWVISNAGASGVYGFTDIANGSVVQLFHDQYNHSDYFYSLNYRGRWIPFLNGKNPQPVHAVKTSKVNWKFIITSVVFLCLSGYLLFREDTIHILSFFPESVKKPSSEKVTTISIPANINDPLKNVYSRLSGSWCATKLKSIDISSETHMVFGKCTRELNYNMYIIFKEQNTKITNQINSEDLYMSIEDYSFYTYPKEYTRELLDNELQEEKATCVGEGTSREYSNTLLGGTLKLTIPNNIKNGFPSERVVTHCERLVGEKCSSNITEKKISTLKIINDKKFELEGFNFEKVEGNNKETSCFQ